MTTENLEGDWFKWSSDTECKSPFQLVRVKTGSYGYLFRDLKATSNTSFALSRHQLRLTTKLSGDQLNTLLENK